METLTIEKLKDMKPNTIFNIGELMSRKWIAIRGEIHDWTIYYGDITDSLNVIAMQGDKIYDKDLIKFLVPCDEESFLMYRY